jgi:outer membrane protein assembly factor BamB
MKKILSLIGIMLMEAVFFNAYGRGYHAACVYIGGKVVVSNRGGSSALYGFNPESGDIDWRYDIGDGEGDVVASRWVHQQKEYVVFQAGRLSDSIICLDPTNGATVWKKKLDGLMNPIRDPSISDDYMVVTQNLDPDPEIDVDESYEIYNICYHLTLDGPVEKWRHHAEKRYNDGGVWPIAHGNFYTGNRTKDPRTGEQTRHVFSVDMETGHRNGEIDGVSPARAGFIQVVEDRVLLQPDGRHGHTTQIYMIGPMPGNFDTLDNWIAEHVSTSSYAEGPIYHAIADGRMFMRGQDGIYCYDLRKGQTSAIDGPMRNATAAASKKSVYNVAIENGNVQITGSLARKATVSVLDLSGRTIAQKQFSRRTMLTLSAAAKGVRIITIADMHGPQYQKKMLIR